MVKIVIENLGRKELAVKDLTKTALQQFQEHFVDWMHACGAKGRCTTCKMEIISGQENLENLTSSELKYFNDGALKKNERLACQVKTRGSFSVRVPKESQLPHLHYTDLQGPKP